MTNYDDTDQLISEFHELLDAEQERDPNFGWDKSKQRFKPEEPTAQPRALPTAPQVRPLAEVEERPISWLWPGHLALGRLTVVAGEPGAGASLLLLEVASRVSRGRSFPGGDFPGAKQDVSDVSHAAAEVLLITHQDAAEVVRPRLAALGADTKKFHVMGDVPDVTFIEETPCVRPFRASSDLAHLDLFLASTPSVKLVVIDPLELYLEQGHRSFPSKTLRELGELAARRGVAIVAAARAPEVPGAANLRRWLDKLSGVAELALLFAVVRDRRRLCRRYLAAAKNTLADMDDALSFETPEGRVVWGRRRVSAAVCWATAARLDHEDAARWLRDELALGPKTAKELRAAADEAGIPWHVVYRAKGIAGADCGRVGGGAGSYFVWSLFDLVEDAEESRESAESSIENTKTGEESAEPTRFAGAPARSAEPTRFAGTPEATEASENEIGKSQESAKSSIENTKTGGESAEPTRFAGAPVRSAKPTRFAGTPEATEASENEIGKSQESAESSIENTKTGEESGEPTRFAGAPVRSAKPTRFAGAPEPTDPFGNEIGNSRESAKSSIENTKTGDAHRVPQTLRRSCGEADREGARTQHEFSHPAEEAKGPRQSEARAAPDVDDCPPLSQPSNRTVEQAGADELARDHDRRLRWRRRRRR